MSVRVLHSPKEGMAVIYDSQTDEALGPLFRADPKHSLDAEDVALQFLEWFGEDCSEYTHIKLADKVDIFKARTSENCKPCHGSGKDIETKHECEECDGEGWGWVYPQEAK